MGEIRKLLDKMHSNSVGGKAEFDEWHDRPAEAAELRAEQAALDLKHNELIAADENGYAFKDWLNAGSVEKALEQARTALKDYMQDDTWLKTSAGEENDQIKALTTMVDALQSAGHKLEAEQFLDDINKALGSIGEKPITVMVIGGDHKFPETCPHCGGALTYSGSLDEIPCPFCAGTVHALN